MAKQEENIVVNLSAEERAIILDVVTVERQDLELARNKNDDAQQYGEVLENLREKLQAA